jgi:hypothetical protein
MSFNTFSTNWKDLYIAAILENDPDKTISRIRDAKMAICDRVEELNGQGSPTERVALSRAMKALTELQDVYSGEYPEALRRTRERQKAIPKDLRRQNAA